MTARSPSQSGLQSLFQGLAAGLLLFLVLFAPAGSCWRQLQQQQHSLRNYRPASQFAARRAADDSRPLLRVAASQPIASVGPPEQVVMGKFKAPAPERIQRQRVPKASEFGSQTISASYRVSEAEPEPGKVVQGVVGSSVATGRRSAAAAQRTVGAKMLVSDEGLNYPPSKLSADIYGNVAEIVTAPPEAVEGDFLLPQSQRFLGQQRRP